VVGFFDDRDIDRIDPQGQRHLLGRISMLSTFAKAEKIELIYIALPMASQPRIRALLEDLHDTTASIYFVPDIFVTDLIQGRMDLVSGLPVVAVCETPFTGLSGVTKRVSDVVLTLLILTLIAVPMLVIALAVRLTSRGPVIFKQRRYGVDGREIVVYKFRTMTVLEDGAEIEQATPGDPRITSVGRVLRKLSLDELPQFFNVLQGRSQRALSKAHQRLHVAAQGQAGDYRLGAGEWIPRRDARSRCHERAHRIRSRLSAELVVEARPLHYCQDRVGSARRNERALALKAGTIAPESLGTPARFLL
jgi:putative colanic acid biosysnthesis UDP-glucose lipid carrier transferase